MILCAAGDIHGALDQLYEDVLAFEVALGVRFACCTSGTSASGLIRTGSNGATKRHDGAGDFPAWCVDQREAPRRTRFIKGNHEDFVWLDAQPGSEVLPNLNKVRMAGNLVAIEAPERGRDWTILGEWPPRMQSSGRIGPHVPTHAPVEETELTNKLVYHDGKYKTVIGTLRIALANIESDLASELAATLARPREAKKTFSPRRAQSALRAVLSTSLSPRRPPPVSVTRSESCCRVSTLKS